MRTFILTIATLISTLSVATAKADGFTCVTEDGDLKVKLYNFVNADNGTRVPARMIVSSGNSNDGAKTLAVFNAESGNLEVAAESAASAGTIYVGKVDLRFSELNTKEAMLLGTRLGDMTKLSLTVDFKYGDSLAGGEQAEALLTIESRNGIAVREPAICTRYKKVD